METCLYATIINIYKVKEGSNYFILKASIFYLLNDIGLSWKKYQNKQTPRKGQCNTQSFNFVNSALWYDCFADDTGFIGSALNGAPGVLSARFAGNREQFWGPNMNKLHKLLYATIANRRHNLKPSLPKFKQCSILILKGRCKAKITSEKRGNHGLVMTLYLKPDGLRKPLQNCQ